MNGESPDEVERALKARAYKRMGITTAMMGAIAAGVGFWWIGRVFGVTPLQALSAAMPLFGIVLALLGLAALGSLASLQLLRHIDRRRGHETEGKQADG